MVFDQDQKICVGEGLGGLDHDVFVVDQIDFGDPVVDGCLGKQLQPEENAFFLWKCIQQFTPAMIDEAEYPDVPQPWFMTQEALRIHVVQIQGVTHEMRYRPECKTAYLEVQEHFQETYGGIF